MLDVDCVSKSFGGVFAVRDVSLSVADGELRGVIGPNGAGKSTLVDTLSGIVRPASGTVRIQGRLAHVPEGRHLFADLTVEDNLRLGWPTWPGTCASCTAGAWRSC